MARLYFLSQEKASLAHNFYLQHFETPLPAHPSATAQDPPLHPWCPQSFEEPWLSRLLSAELQPALCWECRNTSTTVLLSYFLKIQITTLLWFTQSRGRSVVVLLGL